MIPYNPYLLLRFGSHCNVEKVSSLHAVKYLHKYLSKGPPRIELDSVRVRRNDAGETIDADDPKYVYDEIAQHQDFRYLCPTEAVWHILAFPMNGNLK